MNLSKLCKAASLLAGALLCATASFAQAPQVVAVGSSGIFSSTVLAMANGDPITGTTTTCGSNVWTGGSSLASGIDARGGSIPAEGGTLAVVWDNSTTPSVICAYLSVDSVVGQRLFLGTGSGGNGTLSINIAAESTAGASKVSFVKDNATGLPSAVYNLLNGAHFNAAFTDIRAEDGQLAYQRAACNRASVTDPSCFGYGPLGGVGTAIQSSYSQTSAQVVAYAISGADPISNLTVPAFRTIPVGADPVLVIYNDSNTVDGLGSFLPTDITSTDTALIFSGQVGLLDQLVGKSTGSTKTLHAVIREPVSGTYNTLEWQSVHTRDNHGGDFTQEYGFGPTPANCFVPPATPTYAPPTITCANPANAVGSMGATYGGFRTRAIGTGEMVNAVNSTNNPDSIGYAFWGLGTFGGKTHVRYLTFDGADPLYPTYGTNSGNKGFPSCSGFFNGNPSPGPSTFACTAPNNTLPTFDNVMKGGYRVWSTIRALVYNSNTCSTTPSVCSLIASAQDQAHVNIPDFVPTFYCLSGSSGTCTGGTTRGMPSIRSHYPIPGIAGGADNATGAGFCSPDQPGTSPCGSEEGGDMAGKALYWITDQEYWALTSNEFVTYIQ